MNEFSEQIEAIEKEIRETPYHKGTEHHIGKLRARLARLKDRQIESFVKAKGGGGGGGYAIKKQGDASVVLIGPPSAGKSTLLNKLTNAESKVAPYSFTTVSVIPGMLIYRGAYVQILDVPGLIEGAQKGKGRGKEVLSVARSSDLLLIMTDVKRPDFVAKLATELEESGIRINKLRPTVRIEKKLEGGLTIHSNLRQNLGEETIKEVAREFGIKNAEITLKQTVNIDELIDSFSRNRVYIPALFLVNKIDEKAHFSKGNLPENFLTISAERDINLEELKEALWESLGFIRVYLIEEDQEPDYQNSIIMKKGQTINDLALKLGSNFTQRYSMAKIWGAKAKYPGQEVAFNTELVENLQVRFI